MQIFLKTLTEKTIVINVDFNSVDELKKKIYEIECIPVNEQRILFAGKQLERGHLLSEYNIKKESTLYLTLKLRGGFVLMTLGAVAVGVAIYGMASNDSTTKNTVTTDVINDFTQQMSTTLRNSNSASAKATQTMKINAAYAKTLRCNVGFDQSQSVDLRATMDAMTELNEEQTATLANSIATAQSQAIEQANAALNLPGTENDSELDNEVTNEIENRLSMSVDQTFENMNYTKTEATQDATIDLWGMQCVDSSIIIDQNQAIQVFSENLAETIVDIIQEGEAEQDVRTDQTQEVIQKNEGFGASGSASIISIFFLSAFISVITAFVQKGGDDLEEEATGGGGGINWWLLIGMLVGSFIIAGTIKYFIEKYKPEQVCPSEEECSKAWDEVQAKGEAGYATYFRKYHNCRMRHRINEEKPEKFRPHCESYCAHVTRESETQGYPKNPLKWYWCFDGFGDRDSRERPTREEESFQNLKVLPEGEESSEGEEYKNLKVIPEGYSNYY